MFLTYFLLMFDWQLFDERVRNILHSIVAIEKVPHLSLFTVAYIIGVL